MCRIIDASSRGGEVEFTPREVEILLSKKSESIEVKMGIHLDGSMKGEVCNLKFSWKYAPEEISVKSTEGVPIAASRLGGEILIPSRVTGFDSRIIEVRVKWSEKQVKEMKGELKFVLIAKYDSSDADTILINSGRGVKDSEKSPELATFSKNIANLEYIPIEAMGHLGNYRKRSFEDGSTHIDSPKVGKPKPRELQNYSISGTFFGSSEEVSQSITNLDGSGIPIWDSVDEIGRLRRVILHSISVMDNLENKSKRELKLEINKMGPTYANWIKQTLGNDLPGLCELDRVFSCIAIIRMGSSIGGRNGKKITSLGLEIGSHLFEEESVFSIQELEIFKDIGSEGKETYSSEMQIYAIIALIHMKAAGYRVKKADFDRRIMKLVRSVRIFRTERGFLSNLDHIFYGSEVIETTESVSMRLLTGLNWIEKIDF